MKTTWGQSVKNFIEQAQSLLFCPMSEEKATGPEAQGVASVSLSGVEDEANCDSLEATAIDQMTNEDNSTGMGKTKTVVQIKSGELDTGRDESRASWRFLS